MAAGNAGPTTALVRILRADAGRYQTGGVDVLVSTNHVLTCAHVVNDALGYSQAADDHPVAPVWVDMPFLPGSTPHSARVSVWYAVRETSAPDEPEDIVVLEGEISAAMILGTTLAKAWYALNARPLHHAPAPPARPQLAADVRYAGKTKLAFWQRLGESWRELAPYFDIPDYEQARFQHGDECRAIWTWLDNRRRLGELPDALVYITREELAQLLTTGA